MNTQGWLQVSLYLGVLLVLAKPLGWYMARVYAGESVGLNTLLAPVERSCYRLLGIDEQTEQSWKEYALGLVLFNTVGMLMVYGLQRLQSSLPLNPDRLAAPLPDLSFNTAASFISNTNWQSYGGEVTMSYLTQMLGLNVQNFLSAATGMAVLIALIRGLRARSSATIGIFWVDLIRSILYILLPLALILACLLVSQGVVQSFSPSIEVVLLQNTIDTDGHLVSTQNLPLGPAASQIAIKQLGTNGGGFFNVNSAHPFENPTPLSNMLEMLAILLIPVALCFTFGIMVNDPRQGQALLTVMMVIFIPLLLFGVIQEQAGTPQLAALGIDLGASDMQAGGNMEGKETRFGVVNSALWAAATTAASNGSVNSMHDSYTPLGGLVPLFLIQLGEIIFGGVGSGLYGMLIFALITVFIAGLMVGRTPEYLGKKIEAFEIKMAALVLLIPCIVVLCFTALAVTTPWGKGALYATNIEYTSIANPGPHGFSEVLYAYSSMGNNNGSAFAGLGANNPFYNTTGGLAMLIARFWIIVPVLAIAGSLAAKKTVPSGPGTLPTHTPLFMTMLVGVVIIVGVLTFIPALALGPIIEHLMMLGI
ncbi:potassium-transporting ATPase subunit KdpA [Candidatus Oscillochloris fontis]|uniref:potassium-transporting ATPase subunit KdpA n=1 Tax=Candidatus Oscillochloris fontis TaxID=2496868 RepID=UPI00101D890B|nr:potassium-transporting ATPase subunit KdpA [Candidatus Oscillochloris fontis]